MHQNLKMLIEYNTPLCFHTASRQQLNTFFNIIPPYNWFFKTHLFFFFQVTFVHYLPSVVSIILESCYICVDSVTFLQAHNFFLPVSPRK